MRNKWMAVCAVLALALALAGSLFLYLGQQRQVRYGFVNTPVLLGAFSESAKIQKELQADQLKVQGDLQIIKDSLAAFEARMAVEYPQAALARKTELKREQIRRLEEAARFEETQQKRLAASQAEKLQGIYNKINAALVEYGASRGIDVIFGTADGNILYGIGTSADLTADFSAFLNTRYK